MSSLAHNSNHLPLHNLTFEEFLDWCDSDTRAEWINGRVVILSPDNLPHTDVIRFILYVLGIYVEERKLGHVYFEKILMRLPAAGSARMPDVLFVSTARESQLRHTYIDGPADMAVEVVSPESVDRDRTEKFAEYAIAGVREYWLIDPLRKSADFYELGSDKRYRPVPQHDGTFRSSVVTGFWLKTSWLWQVPPPAALDVLRELGVIQRTDS
jgi:Uma2 family endonuclease